jgi:MFS family permease
MLHSIQAYSDFRTLLLGTLATNTAFWMYQVAVGWLALQMTDSAGFVGLTGFASGIPMLILSIPAGIILDRYDRRQVLKLAQTGVMTGATLFAILVAFDALQEWSLLLLAGFHGTAMAFIFPTRNTIVPSLVGKGDLVNAVALNSAVQNATRVIGPSLAGIFLAIFGAAGTFAIAAILQIAALVSTAHLPESAAGQNHRAARSRGGVLHGLRIVRRDQLMFATVLLGFTANILVMPYLNMMPVFAQDLDMGSSGLGLLLTSAGVGTVTGSLLLAQLGARLASPRAQIVTSLAFGLFVMLFALSSSEILAFVLLFLAGFSSATFLAINQTAVQLRVNDEDRGRVMSVYMLTWGMLPFGQLAVGGLADQVGGSLAMALACVASFLCIIVVAMKFPVLWRAKRAP